MAVCSERLVAVEDNAQDTGHNLADQQRCRSVSWTLEGKGRPSRKPR